jgi:hypothetical protein
MITSNGPKNAIVWVLERATNSLRAYSAGNLHRLLYSSTTAKGNRDTLGQVVKFSVPTIANGKVYVGNTNSLNIYGLLPRRQPLNRPRVR